MSHLSRTGLLAVICFLLVLSTSTSVDARVGLDGGKSQVVADIGSAASPPYLVTMEGSTDPVWVTNWLEDAAMLLGSHSAAADRTAWFRDPFDDTDPYDLIPIPFTADTEGSVFYNVTPGSLHASADASASLSPSSYTVPSPDQRPPVTITSPYLAGSFSGVRIYFDDEFTFTSSTLPIGSPIEIEVTQHHQATVFAYGDLGGGPPYPNHAYSEARLKLLTFDSDWGDTNLGGDPIGVLRKEAINGVMVRDDAASQVFSFDIAVGDHIYVDQSLEIWARASATTIFTPAVASADASNTAGLYIRSLTPNVTIETKSGVVYAVPEPSTLVRELSALTLIALRRRLLLTGRA